MADFSKILELFWNILSNASKFFFGICPGGKSNTKIQTWHVFSSFSNMLSVLAKI